MSTYAELLGKIAELTAKAEEQRVVELAAVIADIKAKIMAFNLTAKDLGLEGKHACGTGGMGNRKSIKPVPAKYRHPENRQLVWSGRGRQPKWLTAWMAGDAKRKLEYLLIK